MCLNPFMLLCKKVVYKGVEKTVLLWHTTLDEYFNGFTSIDCGDSRLSSRLCEQLHKYGLSLPVRFDTRIELPCRNCLECTKQRAREWSLRCHFEALKYKHNYFVTLTYNDKYLPRNRVYKYDVDNDIYNVSYVPTLKKEHCFKFMKHLRTVFKRDYSHDGIRFFMCGEYGSSSQRPHYHYNLFNLPLNDLFLFSHSKTGFPIYRSKTLERCWKYGFVTVQPYTIETARYTAQYCCKKLNKEQSCLVGREMEFVNMSRMPAIGSYWFYSNFDKILSKKDGIYDDKIYISNHSNDELSVDTFRCPKAFLRKLLPVTDKKRGLDTDFINDLSFVLNDDNITLYKAYLELKEQNSLNADISLKCEMSKFGFDYENRYSLVYLDYLNIKARSILSKFPIIRNLS